MSRTAILLCTLWLTVACGGGRPGVTYRYVDVDAPFAMDPIAECVFPAVDFPITDYGARTDSDFVNTAAIAAAIDACSRAGGGRVVVPEGTWTTGPIHLKSNVNLYLAEGSVLRFVDDPTAYLPAVETSWEGMECFNYSPLVYAYDADNIGITGTGTLAPMMDLWREWFGRPEPHLNALRELYTMASTDVPVAERQMAVGDNHLRPHLIHLNRCRHILLEDFCIRQSPFWTIHIYMCDGGVMRGLDVSAHGHNNDGVDLEMTRNFLVERCTFDQGDDAVVIKAGRNRDAWRLNTPCENIVIRHCTILSGHTLLGIGSEISGGIRHVYMHHCHAPGTVHRLFFVKTNHRRGAFVEDIHMDSITTGGTLRVLEIDTDVLYQWRNLVPTYVDSLTRIADIHMSRISCDAAKKIYEIRGDERLPIERVRMTDIHVGTVADTICPVANVVDLSVDGITYDHVDPTVLPQLDRYETNK